MANICEKLIEDVSAGSSNLSPELQSHVLTCPNCQQTLAAIKGLKSSRKGMSAKEAAAITAIISKVKAEAATAATVAQTSGRSSVVSGVKLLTLIEFAFIVAVAVFWFGMPESGKDIASKPFTLVEPAKETPANASDAVKTEETISVETTGSTAENEDSARVASDSKQTDLENSPEKDNMNSQGSIMVSPDQEDIKTSQP